MKRRTTILRFARFYKPHWKLFVLDMACALMISLIDLAFPLTTRYALYELLPQTAYASFFLLIAVMAGLYVLRGVFSYIVTYWGHSLGVRIEADMRRDIFTHIQKLPFKFFDRNRTGHLISHITTDLFEITELAHHGPEDIFLSIMTIAGSLIIMLFINWKLALVLFLLVPTGLIFVMLQRRRMTRTSRRVKERTSDINATLETSISGARMTKAFTNEDYEIERFSEGNERFKSSKDEFYASMAVFHSGTEFFLHLFNLAVIGAGGFLIMNGGMEYLDLITFTLYVSSFVAPVRKLTQFTEMFVSGMAGFSRFLEVLDVEPEIVDSPSAKPLKNVRGEIVFNDVSFSYDDKTRVLRDLNLTIRAGKTLALVGPSGGGKTTLCHLIPRFYEINEGAITIDGQDIRELTLESLRANIGIVSQDVFLFNGSVKENIRYGRLDATDAEIVLAAKRAELHEMILAMPEGYDTQIGERGAMLSGGQKQRVSIARIFLKNPPILILDEATSALDSVTEQRIQRSFEELSRGRTTLTIAHRLSTVIHADEIIVIDEQGVVERGKHESLIANAGLYAQLYKAQFFAE